VSKKTRGSARTRHRRPGARPASSRPAASRQPSRPIEAELGSETLTSVSPAVPEVEEARPAEQRREVDRPAPRTSHGRPRAKPGSLLAARAATEYVYVAQDLKRISVVGSLLFGALIVLWLAVVVLRVIPLPFY
jgi:hypothetical protein